MTNAKKFKRTDVGRQEGERARLKVVQGPDFGSIYVITGPKVSIGRGEGNDIVLTDLKSSRIHAIVSQDSQGKWKVKDQGSANGILYNSQVTREADIKFNDIITLGETSLEFISADLGTKVLMAPPRTISKIEEDRKNLQAAKKRVGETFGQSASPGGDPANRKKLVIYGVLVLGVGLLFLGGPDKPPAKKANESSPVKVPSRDFASFLPAPEFNKASDTLLKDGLREYFDHNFGRARVQFQTVLQISPGHALATLYLENCNKSIEEEVKLNLEGGKKSLDAGKYREAKGHFETILRLLYREQTNPAYIEAKEQLNNVVKAMKVEGEKS